MSISHISNTAKAVCTAALFAAFILISGCENGNIAEDVAEGPVQEAPLLQGAEDKPYETTGTTPPMGYPPRTNDSRRMNADEDYSPFVKMENGRHAIYLESEDIYAYLGLPDVRIYHSLGFGLVPCSEDEKLDNKLKYNDEGDIIFDWGDYQHRLSEASYHFVVNSDLEPDIDRLIHQNLTFDGVVSELSYLDVIARHFPEIVMTSGEVFDDFVSENVRIDYVGDLAQAEQIEGIDAINLTWVIFRGGCFRDYSISPRNRCYRHAFKIWLIDFSEDYRVIWDMKYVEEAGCGKRLD